MMDAKTIEYRLLTKDSVIGTISIKKCAEKLVTLKDKFSSTTGIQFSFEI